eukprot:Nitzschia sp. Nitz4//scaffold13_size275219//256373//257884//NITZ4_000926-RA/size275219-augustus-gene-0.243-mRNA-1//1//CDS//3329536170//6204//frame0
MSNDPESPGDESASRKRRKVEGEADESSTQVEETSEAPKTEESPNKEDKESATPDQENKPIDDPAVTTTTTTDEANETSKDETMQEVGETEKPSDPATTTPTNPEESIPPAPKESEYPYDSLRWTIVKNDGRPESLIKLIALKSLFAKQLPKMPRAYIARLVFDLRHISLVILSQDPALKDTDEEVIGSICYRPFPEMRFAEIAFCAVNATHQVKGYGTKLMNLVKKEGARTGIEYFITYADNYAIGYFKKQGFSKTVTMPKGRYQGLIKDYDGGTMMECYVHPSIDFTRIPEMLHAQRRFILQQISLKANSTRVNDPLPNGFSPNLEGVSRANEAAARAMAIPGMVEAGWTMADILSATGQGKDVDRAKSALRNEMLQIVRKVEEQQFAWPFREPVDTNEVKDYLDVIKEPIDLSTIDKRIRKGDHYKSKQMLYADLILMVNNCKLYNDEASTYVQCAISLEKFLGSLFVN